MSDLEATAREAIEVAEEELAFVKDTGSDKMVVSRRATYKRQRVLARGVLELLEERDRLRDALEFYAGRVLDDGGQKAREALAPREEQR